MTTKLTDTQILYLKWLKEGHSVQFCTEVSNQLGVMSYSDTPPLETNRRSILNLLRDGYVSISEESSYGIRWAVLFINPKGLALLESVDE